MHHTMHLLLCQLNHYLLHVKFPLNIFITSFLLKIRMHHMLSTHCLSLKLQANRSRQISYKNALFLQLHIVREIEAIYLLPLSLIRFSLHNISELISQTFPNILLQNSTLLPCQLPSHIFQQLKIPYQTGIPSTFMASSLEWQVLQTKQKSYFLNILSGYDESFSLILWIQLQVFQYRCRKTIQYMLISSSPHSRMLYPHMVFYSSQIHLDLIFLCFCPWFCLVLSHSFLPNIFCIILQYFDKYLKVRNSFSN